MRLPPSPPPVEKWTPERRRARTRAALLEAARFVFARKGFEGASLDEIAETAGYTRGAIYKHFRGKEDLLFAVYDQVNEQALERYSDLLDDRPRSGRWIPCSSSTSGRSSSRATPTSARWTSSSSCTSYAIPTSANGRCSTASTTVTWSSSS